MRKEPVLSQFPALHCGELQMKVDIRRVARHALKHLEWIIWLCCFAYILLTLISIKVTCYNAS